jgi:D-aminoacyl-tRNA deacylase
MIRPDAEDWDPITGDLPSGQWQHSIKVALESTKQSFPGGQIIAHLDRKSFKGWQRQVIKRYCERLELPIGRTKDFQ